jgi:hypothetical protein
VGGEENLEHATPPTGTDQFAALKGCSLSGEAATAGARFDSTGDAKRLSLL